MFAALISDEPEIAGQMVGVLERTLKFLTLHASRQATMLAEICEQIETGKTVSPELLSRARALLKSSEGAKPDRPRARAAAPTAVPSRAQPRPTREPRA